MFRDCDISQLCHIPVVDSILESANVVEGLYFYREVTPYAPLVNGGEIPNYKIKSHRKEKM